MYIIGVLFPAVNNSFTYIYIFLDLFKYTKKGICFSLLSSPFSHFYFDKIKIIY